MKKTLSILLILVLCLSSIAVAQAAPKVTKVVPDITRAVVEYSSESKTKLFLLIHDTNVSADQLDRLLVAKTVNDYFGNINTLEGGRTKLFDLMGSESVKISEYTGIDVSEYQASYGDVKVKARFMTKYKAGEDKVIVLIGKPGRSLAWTALDATVADNGAVEFVIPADLAAGVQVWTGVIAVASCKAQ